MVENRMVIDSEWEPLERIRKICCCSDCERDLYEGDKAYRIGGEVYCEECIDNYGFYLEEE